MKNELAVAALVAALSACNAQAPAPAATDAAAAPAPSAAVADAAEPASTPPEPSAEDAAAVVRDYYAAIDARDYAAAYAKWSNGGAASNQDFTTFGNGYAETESVRATVGAARDLQGAAGSRYITVPVEIRAQQKDGSVRRYRGEFALRAVVADGASEEQRKWHLHSAVLQRLPD